MPGPAPQVWFPVLLSLSIARFDVQAFCFACATEGTTAAQQAQFRRYAGNFAVCHPYSNPLHFPSTANALTAAVQQAQLHRCVWPLGSSTYSE